MLKGAGSPILYGTLARGLFQQAARFSGEQVFRIEQEMKQKLLTDVLPTFSDVELNFRQNITNLVSNLKGRLVSEHALIRGFDLNPGFKETNGANLPDYLKPQQITLRSNGVCFIPIFVNDYFSEAYLKEYTDFYQENAQLRRIAHVIWQNCMNMTYTQLLSMFPIIERLWQGDTPPINPKELKTFGFRDNHEYNDILERVLVNAKILGLTKGWKIVPVVSQKNFLVNLYIEETQ